MISNNKYVIVQNPSYGSRPMLVAQSHNLTGFNGNFMLF